MKDWYPKPLPRGYGVAAIDPPEERIPWCVCGHSSEDHDLSGLCNIRGCECEHFEETDGIYDDED